MQELQILRNYNFTKLWLAQVLSQIGQHLLNFALIIKAFELSQGSGFANISVGLLVMSFGVPSILFSALAGVYVDRWDRRWVLVATNLGRAALIPLYILIDANFGLVLALSFAVSSLTQFFVPAESAAIPVLVKDKQLVQANSLFIFTLYSSFIIGYSLSAPVIGWLGATGPYWLTAGMFAAAGVLAAFLPRLQAPQAVEEKVSEVAGAVWAQLKRSWGVLKGNPNLYFPILQLTVTQAMVGIMMALAPALSAALLKIPLKEAAHVLIIPAGIGMVLGVMYVPKLMKRFESLRIVSVNFLLAGGALIALGLSGQLYRVYHGEAILSVSSVTWVVATLILLLGLFNALISVTAQTLLQQHSSDETRGKIFGALNMMINLAGTLPILFVAVVADLLSVTKVIMILGAAFMFYALWQFRTLERHRRALAK